MNSGQRDAQRRRAGKKAAQNPQVRRKFVSVTTVGPHVDPFGDLYFANGVPSWYYDTDGKIANKQIARSGK